MPETDARSWADAIGMYAHRYTIAKVTGREHEDWALDVGRLMHESTPDIRGWRVNDPKAGEPERVDDPYYPFVEVPSDPEKAQSLRSRVHEIPRSSARKLLVALSTLWLNIEKTKEFEQHRAEWEEKADVVLARFPDGSRFYANTGRDSAELDYYKKISGCSTISRHVWDVGLFLVSDTEVGMVWSFHAW
ncbi:hypothetical protein DN402_19830 [Streptomyces sp. SW4]|nr:hypothetical protein DN402_19830 [Streptomyces sp. SW4]